MKRISILLALFALISCGSQISEVKQAPRTSGQVGIITSCTTRSQAQELSKTQGIQFRVINEKRNVIEYIGLDKKTLKSLLPKARFVDNKIYESPLVKGQELAAQSTGDQAFYGAHSPVQYRNSSAGSYFPHLRQIDALSLSSYQGQGVTIAIIDTGVYYNHPHLSPNIKTNPAEQSGNGSDSDGNGLVDDYIGWDFYNGDAYPMDDNGHGTHVAGLAASTYSGVAPRAKILPIKVLGQNGSGDLGTIAQGILYAIDQGADIINLSLGGSVPNLTQDLQRLINSVQFAKSNNALVISASGNGGSDGVGYCNDGAPIYPANINSNNVVSVGAVNRYDALTNYSNYGFESVDVAAPGGDQYTGFLLSTAIENVNGPYIGNAPYVGNSGTSMATPITSGVAALIKSKHPSYSYSQIKDILEQSVTVRSALYDQIKTSGVVNAARALSL